MGSFGFQICRISPAVDSTRQIKKSFICQICPNWAALCAAQCLDGGEPFENEYRQKNQDKKCLKDCLPRQFRMGSLRLVVEQAHGAYLLRLCLLVV